MESHVYYLILYISLTYNLLKQSEILLHGLIESMKHTHFTREQCCTTAGIVFLVSGRDNTQILLKTYDSLEIYSIMRHVYYICRERSFGKNVINIVVSTEFKIPQFEDNE
jgi:hypothetical protein